MHTGFTEGLWLDLAGSGIHAAVIHVGPIDTEIWHKTDEPTAYRGRKLPPRLGLASHPAGHRGAPSRGLGAGGATGRLVVLPARSPAVPAGRGALRPSPADVVAAARERARAG